MIKSRPVRWAETVALMTEINDTKFSRKLERKEALRRQVPRWGTLSERTLIWE